MRPQAGEACAGRPEFIQDAARSGSPASGTRGQRSCLSPRRLLRGHFARLGEGAIGARGVCAPRSPFLLLGQAVWRKECAVS